MLRVFLNYLKNIYFWITKTNKFMKRFLISLMLSLPICAIAQSNFQKGYYVNNAGDTIKGVVDYKPRITASGDFRFKPDGVNDAQTINLENAKSYGIVGYESYERFRVNISQGPVKTEQLKVGADSSLVTATVFLKVVQKGPKLALYSYTDDIKKRFYIKNNDAEVPYELIRTKHLDPKYRTSIVSRDRYKGQLMFELSRHNVETNHFREGLSDLEYTDADITKVVSMINGLIARPMKNGTRFFASAGLASSELSYSGKHILSNSAAVKSASTSFSISIGADLFNNSPSERWIYRAELFLINGKDLSVSNSQNVHTMDHLTFYFNPKVLFNFYNTEALKVFVGGGLGVNYSIFNNNKAGRFAPNPGFDDQFEETDLKVSSSSFSFNAHAGVLFRKKFEISMMYVPPYSISNYTAYKINLGIKQASFKYHFN